MKKWIKLILIYEFILLLIFIIGYFVFESQQPTEEVYSCNFIEDNGTSYYPSLENDSFMEILKNMTIRENLNT
jgi:hypothetical protein